MVNGVILVPDECCSADTSTPEFGALPFCHTALLLAHTGQRFSIPLAGPKVSWLSQMTFCATTPLSGLLTAYSPIPFKKLGRLSGAFSGRISRRTSLARRGESPWLCEETRATCRTTVSLSAYLIQHEPIIQVQDGRFVDGQKDGPSK
jgi:hypothetical protein